MLAKILIIDDDNLVCLSLKKVLQSFNYEVEVCQNASESFEYIEKSQPDIILLDIYLSVADGLDILKETRARYPNLPVIMITGYSDVNLAVKAMKIGAYDFLLKPIDLDQLQFVLNKSIEHLNLKKEVERLRIVREEEPLDRDFLGKSKVIQKVINLVERWAKSEDTTILLEGESGVGKEVFARYIHQVSPRSSKVFIPINCAAIPKELAESELFGHEKGAFTGAAQKTKQGKFELAHGGTILLDEIGELTLDLQVKLLRVLQEKKFYRLGGEKEISVNVRVLAATNKNLEEEVKKGNFREDLFYRLNVAKAVIPPLRERKEDIPQLVYSFISEFSHKFNIAVTKLTDDALRTLIEQHWKGNIRELRNVIERAMLLVDGDTLCEEHLDFLVPPKPMDGPGDGFYLRIPKSGISIEVVLKSLILQTLEITKGNQVRAAKILGLSRSKLRYRMEQLKIEVTKKIE